MHHGLIEIDLMTIDCHRLRGMYVRIDGMTIEKFVITIILSISISFFSAVIVPELFDFALVLHSWFKFCPEKELRRLPHINLNLGAPLNPLVLPWTFLPPPQMPCFITVIL